MKHVFATTLFAFALTACLDVPAEPPVSSPAPDDIADRGDESSYDYDMVYYCYDAAVDGICVQAQRWFAQAQQMCLDACRSYGYANPRCLTGTLDQSCYLQ